MCLSFLKQIVKKSLNSDPENLLNLTGTWDLFIYLLIDWHSKFVCSMHQMVNERTVGVPSEAEVTLPPTIRYRQNKELCWQPQPQSYHSGCILFTAHNTSLRWHRIFVEWLNMLSENVRGLTETLPAGLSITLKLMVDQRPSPFIPVKLIDRLVLFKECQQ